MINHPSRQPLGVRLIRMMLISVLAALLIMVTGILLHKYHNDYQVLHQQTLMLAEIIASRSTGALEFEDKHTAEENLHALSINPHILYAAIVSRDGELFSQYIRPPTQDYSLDLLLDGLLANNLLITLPIELESRVIGNLIIRVSLDGLKQQLMTYLFSLLLITVIAFLVALFLFQRLQKQVSEPLAQLIAATVSVSNDENYNIRVNSSADGDIAVLIDGFNEMLKQIQIREHKLAEAQDTLKAKIASQDEALSQANEQRLEWLETMAGFLRHELKNTTVGVNSSLDLLERRLAKGASIEIYLQRARKSMHYMTALLNSASAASSLEAAIHQEQLHPLHLSALVSEHCDEYQSLYVEEQFKIRCEPGLFILGSAVRICQLLDKLVSNAVDHHQPDTIIEVTLCQDQQSHARITVSNDGPALPADGTRLFELFFSLRPAEAQNQNNLGLGLYVVRLIAASHQGQVFAQNRDTGAGAVFNVVLPLL